jgi:ankyrin repeat protein
LNVAEFAAWFGANNDGKWVNDYKTTLQHNTPLHLGMIYNAPAEVIKLLVEACPAAVKVKDKDGKTPLDYGLSGVPPEALAAHREGMSPVELCRSFLLAGVALNVAEFAAWFGANNDGKWVKEKTKNGIIPLHDGMRHKTPAEATPLHYGMIHKAPVEVIKLLVEAYPKAVKEKDKYGNTPLHYGMIHKAPAEAIKLLVEACPEAVKVKDNEHRTPLRFGMIHEAPAVVLELLHPLSLPIDACCLYL